MQGTKPVVKMRHEEIDTNPGSTKPALKKQGIMMACKEL